MTQTSMSCLTTPSGSGSLSSCAARKDNRKAAPFGQEMTEFAAVLRPALTTTFDRSAAHPLEGAGQGCDGPG